MDSPTSFRILIIDDNKDFADSLQIICGLLGYSAVSVYSGRQGLLKAEEYKPKLVFCDIGLPDINGFEVAQEIRKTYTLTEMILIALSGYGQEEYKDHAKESGFNHYIEKPINSYQVKQN